MMSQNGHWCILLLNVVFQSNLRNCKLAIHVFQLHDDGPATEELEEDIAAANHWLLPCGIYHSQTQPASTDT